MTIIQYIYIYLLTIPVFFLIDMVWLGFVARNFYREQIGHLLGDVNWVAAVIFYLIYIVGIVLFAINPAIKSGSWTTALLFGALFGFFAYATYDFTNLATLKDWPILVTIVDIVWGTVLTGVVATGGYLLARAFVL